MRELAAHPDVTLLPRTTAFGCYDGNLVGLVERVTDHLAGAAGRTRPRQRLWKVRARAVVLATGAHERAHRVREQRPAGHDARRRRAHVRRALRGAARARAPSCSRTTTARTRRRSRCTLPASRSPRSSTPRSRGAARRRAGRSAAREAGLPIVAQSRDRRRARPPARRRGRRRAAGRRRATPARLRSRLRFRRLESGGPPLLAGARHAALRRRAGHLRPDALAAADRAAGAANGRFDLAAALADGHAAGSPAAAPARASRRSLAAAAPNAVAIGALRAAVERAGATAKAPSASSTCRTTSPSTTSRSPRAKATRRSST